LVLFFKKELLSFVMPARRKRRSSEEVQARILDAAGAVFSVLGYEGATTREIAQRADVSETLLFRYFNSKTTLFDQVVFAPFDQLMGRFLQSALSQATYAERVRNSERFIAALFAFLDENRALVGALTLARGGVGERFDGLRSYFAAAAAQVEMQHAVSGGVVDVKPDLAVRLGFGMVVAAVLMEDWLFPDGAPDRREIVEALARMLTRALDTEREVA
jgi:AcrR family transcriptional regulator